MLAAQESMLIVLRDLTSGPFEENPPWNIEGKHLKRPFEANYSDVTVTVITPCGVVVTVTVIALCVVIVTAVTPHVVLWLQSLHHVVLQSWWLSSCCM
jgi:hypothetical protein